MKRELADGTIRDFTPAEEAAFNARQAYLPPTSGEVYDQMMKSNRLLKALVLCINDGSIVPGARVSNTALKAAIKEKL